MDQPRATPCSLGDSSPLRTSGRGWSIAVGVLLFVLGAAAIAFPFISSVAVTLVVAWLLVISGLLTVIHAIGTRGRTGSLWNGLTGLVFVLGGILLISAPLAGTLSLTLLLAAILVVEGVLKIIGAVRLRGRPVWGWLLASGLIALLAGVSIALAFPTSAVWVLGLFVGLNFIFTGLSYIMDFDDATAPRPPGAA